jgi:hypothetical protein
MEQKDDDVRVLKSITLWLIPIQTHVFPMSLPILTHGLHIFLERYTLMSPCIYSSIEQNFIPHEKSIKILLKIYKKFHRYFEHILFLLVLNVYLNSVNHRNPEGKIHVFFLEKNIYLMFIRFLIKIGRLLLAE